MKHLLCLLMALLLLPICFSANTNAETTEERFYGTNHTYLPYGWVYHSRTDEFVNEELDRLQAYGFSLLYINLGSIGLADDGNGGYTIESSLTRNDAMIARFIKLSSERGLLLCPIINCGFTDAFFEIAATDADGTEHPYYELVMDEIVSVLYDDVENGYLLDGTAYFAEGYHLDVEPFKSNMQEPYLELLKRVRAAIGEERFLSAATPAWNGAWSAAYCKQAAAYLDEFDPMVYDSNGPSSWGGVQDGVTQTAAEYIELVRTTCVQYCKALKNTCCAVSPTAPVYEDRCCYDGQESFPADGSGLVYYHLNEDPVTGEALETLDNFLAGVTIAKAEGADLAGVGVFHWYYLSGDSEEYQPAVKSCYDWETKLALWKSYVTTPANEPLVGTLGSSVRLTRHDAIRFGAVLYTKPICTLASALYTSAAENAIVSMEYGFVLRQLTEEETDIASLPLMTLSGTAETPQQICCSAAMDDDDPTAVILSKEFVNGVTDDTALFHEIFDIQRVYLLNRECGGVSYCAVLRFAEDLTGAALTEAQNKRFLIRAYLSMTLSSADGQERVITLYGDQKCGGIAQVLALLGLEG